MTVVAFLLMLLLETQPQFQSAPGSPLAGSVACQACHADVYAKWSDSIHGRMIRRANRTRVGKDVEAG